MSGFFSSRPRFPQSAIVTVSDAQQHMPAFKALYEAYDRPEASVNNCGPDYPSVNWRQSVQKGVINAAGSPVELDFFYKIAGGPTTDIEATDHYIKSNTDVDYNIYAAAAVNGAGPGQATNFVMAASMHHAGGKYSNVVDGGQIYIYEDDQWVTCTNVDRTNDSAHVVTVIPNKVAYTVNVRAGKPMMFSPVQRVGGTSCPTPASSWITDGYISRVQPLRLRKDWKIPTQLDKSYRDILNFAIIFDENGKEVDSWEYKEKHTARQELNFRENLEFFIGQKIDNPALLTTITDDQFPGYEGYLPSVKYGGGIVWDYGKAQGYDLVSDFTPMMLRQDAKKRVTEYIGLVGLNFMMNMEDRNNTMFQSTNGCTYETFTRDGAPDEQGRTAAMQLGLKSWKRGNFTIHWNVMSALSDRRSIGNHDFPYLAMLMPSAGLKDSNGDNVPVVQWYKPRGWGYSEADRNYREIDGCEYIGGDIIKASMMAVHNPDAHIVLQPKNY